MTLLKWLMRSASRWSLASAVFGAAVYSGLCWLYGGPVDLFWLATIPAVSAVSGWFAWENTYGPKRGGQR